jgi:Spy/CpxP family protein refolding chaperone
MDKHAEATKALYAVLTPEQQKVFDAHAMPGRGGMQGKPGGRGPMAPMAPKQ